MQYAPDSKGGLMRAYIERLLAAGGVRVVEREVSRARRTADRVAQHLNGAGIKANALHGNKSQPQREPALAGLGLHRGGASMSTSLLAVRTGSAVAVAPSGKSLKTASIRGMAARPQTGTQYQFSMWPGAKLLIS
jgi:hypothetical protein